MKASSGAGSEQVLITGVGNQFPVDWSHDGRFLLYRSDSPGPANDLWILPLTGDRKAFPYLDTPANELRGQFSPDSRWIAYLSNESGRVEVYVDAFDGSHGATGGKRQISSGGGNMPRWRPDGNGIFYVSPDNTLMAAAVSGAHSTFDVSAVERLFAGRPPGTGGYFYEPSPDGRRFLVNMGPVVEAASTPITVVLNWTAGIRN